MDRSCKIDVGDAHVTVEYHKDEAESTEPDAPPPVKAHETLTIRCSCGPHFCDHVLHVFGPLVAPIPPERPSLSPAQIKCLEPAAAFLGRSAGDVIAAARMAAIEVDKARKYLDDCKRRAGDALRRLEVPT